MAALPLSFLLSWLHTISTYLMDGRLGFPASSYTIVGEGFFCSPLHMDRIVSHVKSDRRMLSDEAIQKVDSAICRNNHHALKELDDNIFLISSKDMATALSAWFRKQQPHQSRSCINSSTGVPLLLKAVSWLI
jgi:hypothetical protein